MAGGLLSKDDGVWRDDSNDKLGPNAGPVVEATFELCLERAVAANGGKPLSSKAKRKLEKDYASRKRAAEPQRLVPIMRMVKANGVTEYVLARIALEQLVGVGEVEVVEAFEQEVRLTLRLREGYPIIGLRIENVAPAVNAILWPANLHDLGPCEGIPELAQLLGMRTQDVSKGLAIGE